MSDASTGPVKITGTGSPAIASNTVPTSNNAGVRIYGASTEVMSSNGNLSITGTGGGTGSNNYGVDIEGGALIEVPAPTALLNGGAISIAGTAPGAVGGGGGGSGGGGGGTTPGTPTGNSNDGVYIGGTSTQVIGQGGGVSITGTGSGTGTGESGIDLETGATVKTSVNGPLKMQGTGSAVGSGGDVGVLVNIGSETSGGLHGIGTDSGSLSVIGTGGGTHGGNVGIVIQGESEVLSNTGIVTLNGTGASGDKEGNDGVDISEGTIYSGAGGVIITGNGNGSDANEVGVKIESGSVSGNGSAPVKITGTGSPQGTSDNTGVYVSGLVTTQNGALGITGTGGGSDGAGLTLYSQGGNDGIKLADGAEVQAQQGGVVTLGGTGGNGDEIYPPPDESGGGGGETEESEPPDAEDSVGNIGVYFDGGEVNANSGGVTITGNGNGSGDAERGVVITTAEENGGVAVSAQQHGIVKITGTASPFGREDCSGVYIQGGGELVTTQTGALSITGTGGGTSDDEYGIDDRGQIESGDVGPGPIDATHAGAITLTGTGGNGSSDSSGVYIITGGGIQAEPAA